ncbi:flagellar filament capping protein FliD [Marinagarivorans cellulosilyticus]|uniref:Flagellar hook-associated protein 2 n=1 Tax=Marinagarivorans cellulosilyticus TaxID=2721545 RepID=A0AAN1WKK2_9GAMM|nr:flagellar filament capping protein FliD [Marinagarivorans cellulosilyticus]BCD99292.1 flagellar hook-associated protein 2 [Marinagarivorans cellulosilyticus]
MIENNIIQSLGAGSGIDSRNLVTQLTEIERSAPQARIDTKTELKETQISDFGKIKSALSTFQASVEALTSDEGLFSKSASFTESDALVPTGLGTDVASGTYKFEVTSLAQSQSLASPEFSSEDDQVGEGTLTFNFGHWDSGTFEGDADATPTTITIDSTNNSLKGLRDEINNAEMGVTASIVNNGSGYVLLMTAESGENNELEITVAEAGGSPTDTDDNDLSRFGYTAELLSDPMVTPTRLTQQQAGTDATLVVNSLTVNRSTNSVTDVVDGLTLDLLKSSPGEIISVTVSDDIEFAKQTTRDFVDAYNALLEELEPVIGYDEENEQYGSLVNDSLAKSVVGQMRNIFASSVTGLPEDATFKALTNLGIRTELDGTLSITDKEFDAAFKDNLEDVQNLLSASTKSSASDITVNSFGKQTVAGEYDIVVTTTPRKGAFTGDTVAQGFPFDTDSLSFGLNLIVNGVESDLITVPTDVTYDTEADLAAAMQSAINADANLKAAGATVTVAFDTDHFVMTSTKYGASSNVNVDSVTGDVDSFLKIAQGNGSAGRDVAGTVDGVVGFGLGQVLLPKLGEAAEGLSVVVGENATSTTVNFSRGVGGQLDELIDTFLQSNGLIDKREETLERDISTLEGEEERLDRRMSAYEERLMQQFIAMENILNGLNNSGSFLDNLFKSLPFTSSKD